MAAAIAVIRKKDSNKIRLIVDHSLRDSRGKLHGVNAITSLESLPPIELPSLDRILRDWKADPSHKVAVVDIQEAYRHLRLAPTIQPLRYRVGNMIVIDQAAPMGAAGSAHTMQAVVRAVLFALKRKFPSIYGAVYIDDILLKGSSPEIDAAYACLLSWLERINLPPSPAKLQPPQDSVTYLGINLSTRTQEASWTREKQQDALVRLQRVRRHLDKVVRSNRNAPESLCAECRCLAGKLQAVCLLCPPLRAFLRGLSVLGSFAKGRPKRGAPVRFIGDAIPAPGPEIVSPRRSPAHAEPARARLRWSSGVALRQIRHIEKILRTQLCRDLQPQPDDSHFVVYSDASTRGGGAVIYDAHGDLVAAIYVTLPRFEAPNISAAEMIVPATILRLRHMPWCEIARPRLTWFMDNAAGVCVLTQWAAKTREMAAINEDIAHSVIDGGISTQWQFIAGAENVNADRISRLEPQPSEDAIRAALRPQHAPPAAAGGNGSDGSMPTIHRIRAPRSLTKLLFAHGSPEQEKTQAEASTPR